MWNKNTSRRLLQFTAAIAALVPVLAGLSGMFFGPGMIADVDRASLAMDSHFRYLSGLLLGIGIGFWTTVPRIETKTARFRLLAAIVILGGLARLYSLLTLGVPDQPMLFGLAMELVIVPLLVVWQTAVARHYLHT